MTEQPNDFQIIFVKMAEVQEQIAQEQGKVSDDAIKELDEIRELREIVMDVQATPQVFFVTT